MSNVFEDRRKNDPQGLINDLLGQSSRQAKEIGDRGEEIERLKKMVRDLGGDPDVKDQSKERLKPKKKG